LNVVLETPTTELRIRDGFLPRDGAILTPDQRQEIRELILRFETELGKVPGAVFGDSDLCPLKHTFAAGVYLREMFIPAGVALVGEIHRHAHPVFMVKGLISIITDNGLKLIRAPYWGVSPAGVKRIGYAHEDTTWITVHATTETDLAKIRKSLVVESFAEFERELMAERKLVEVMNEIPELENTEVTSCP
jgi:hypothetical protein